MRAEKNAKETQGNLVATKAKTRRTHPLSRTVLDGRQTYQAQGGM